MYMMMSTTSGIHQAGSFVCVSQTSCFTLISESTATQWVCYYMNMDCCPTSRSRIHQAGLPIEERIATSIAQEHLSGSPNAACRAPDCPTALKMAMFTTKTHDKSSVP